MTNRLPTFWKWFLSGLGGRPGYVRLLGWFALVHLAIGLAAACLVQENLKEVATLALFPLIGIFVGLTFSWAGNAHALMQSKELITLAKHRAGGVAEYVFTFQLCVLVVLVVITAWVLPLLKLTYLLSDLMDLQRFNFCASVLLYALISLSFRTSWQAVLGANMLLISRTSDPDFRGD